MLPAASRLTHRDEFVTVLRRGLRSGRSRLVVHMHIPADAGGRRAGLVVSKAVGGSVVRHRVSRRLRHLIAPRLGTLPDGAMVVVRALPSAADATSAELGDDLDSGLTGVVRKHAGGARRG
ncbi:ribonuclease P protein component [Pseudonocardia sp. CNS-004]|nr:ribonuclease P protein component [Pseudonocardia sp. CNS-004]